MWQPACSVSASICQNHGWLLPPLLPRSQSCSLLRYISCYCQHRIGFKFIIFPFLKRVMFIMFFGWNLLSTCFDSFTSPAMTKMVPSLFLSFIIFLIASVFFTPSARLISLWAHSLTALALLPHSAYTLLSETEVSKVLSSALFLFSYNLICHEMCSNQFSDFDLS